MATKKNKFCTWEGCDSKSFARTLCAYHYGQLIRLPKDEIPTWLQPCRRCGTPFGGVNKRGSLGALCLPCREGWRWCVDCDAAWEIGHYKVKQVITLPCPMHVRDRQLKFRLGITLAEYSDLLRGQGGTCAIEGCDERDDLHVDHDHRCCPVRKACRRCIRGLICARHNHALGKVRDSIADLEALARYLVRCHTEGIGGSRGD